LRQQLQSPRDLPPDQAEAARAESLRHDRDALEAEVAKLAGTKIDASFKLDKSGESIGLYGADGNPVDFADPSGRGGVAIALPGAAPKGGDMWEYFQLALISLRDATIVAATVYTLDCFAVYEFTSQVGWLVDTPLGPLDKCKSSRPVKCYALEFTIVPASSSPTDKVIPTQLCHYVCDDGTSFTRLAPAKKKCPSPIDKP